MTAWDSPAHAPEYDYLANCPRWLRRRFYDRYPEMQALPETVSTIMEVGCATGEVARYLLDRYPNAFYVGYDVSNDAIKRAWAKGLKAAFVCRNFQDSRRTAQLVFCRDVVHHQDDPWQFLTDLYNATEQVLIVRLRTTSGPTYNRGQRLYGKPVNYWMINNIDLSEWKAHHTSIRTILFDKDEPPVPFWMRVLIWWYRTCM